MSENKNSVTLYLMGEKGLSVLKALLPFKRHISQVIGASDNDVEYDYFDEIRDFCIKEDIKWADRHSNPQVDSTYSIAIAWRWLIQQEEGNTLIILHDSLLPKYRGFAPLVNMLINHEPQIGVTALFANEEFDKGDIICQRRASINYPIRIREAIGIVSELYVSIAQDIFNAFSEGHPLIGNKQDESKATYSLWRDEKDYDIDWNKDAEFIQQFVYSVGFPYKGASTTIDGKRYRVHDCEIIGDVFVENRCPGKVLFFDKDQPIVVCGKGLLRITKLETIDGESCLPLKKYRIRFE